MYSLTQTTFLSFKMLSRNKKRGLVISLGITIAVLLVICMFSYIDYSEVQVIDRSVSNIPIDLSAYQPAGSPSVLNSNELTNFQDYLNSYKYSYIINSTDLLLGNKGFGGSSEPWGVVGTGNNLSLGLGSGGGAISDSPQGNIAHTLPSTILGVEYNYFKNFGNIFQMSSSTTGALTNSTIYVSQSLANSLGLYIGDSLNVSIQTIGQGSETINTFKEFNISGIINVNQVLFQKYSDSFFNQNSQSGFKGFSPYSDQIVFMNINAYRNFISNSNEAAINVFQIKLNHSSLNNDIQGIVNQINLLENFISLKYSSSSFTSDLTTQLSLEANQLNTLRLMLLYLAIPSILIGFYLTKYATDLVLMERKKELIAFRAKSLSQEQIRNYIVIETFSVAGLGTFLGFIFGWAISIILNSLQTNFTTFNFVLSEQSIILAFLVGILLSVLSGINTARTVMKTSVIEGMHTISSTNEIFWKKFYLDFFLLGIGFVLVLMSEFKFNPIPGFSQALSNLILPLCSWIGFGLFLVRILEVSITKSEQNISRILVRSFGQIGFLISKGISRKPERMTQLTTILILILSFGVIIGTVSNTYNVNAIQQSQFMVGSDLRVQLPASNELTYNVSDFQQNISNTIPDLQFTPVFMETVPLGPETILLIGIDLHSFLNVAYFPSSFLKSHDIQNTFNRLKFNPNNLTIVISSNIQSPPTPFVTSTGGTQNSAPLYNIGDGITFNVNNHRLNFTVIDIANYFPAISDVLQKNPSDINFAFVDASMFSSQTIPGINGSITQNSNATMLLGKFESNKGNTNINQDVKTINSIYQNLHSNYPILIETANDYLNQNLSTSNLLIELSDLELGLILICSIFALGIFMSTTLIFKKGIIGTYRALGAKLNEIIIVMIGEMVIGSLYAFILSIVLGIIVSFTYLGFIGGLFVIPLSGLFINPVYILITYVFLSVAIITACIYSVYKIYNMRIFETLRQI